MIYLQLALFGKYADVIKLIYGLDKINEFALIGDSVCQSYITIYRKVKE